MSRTRAAPPVLYFPKSGPPCTEGVVRHFRRQGRAIGDVPFFLFHVSIDLRDVRSGLKDASTPYFRAFPIDDPFLEWAGGLVQEVSPETLEEIAPPREVPWPEHADRRLREYLNRHHSVRILRNASLALYSGTGQSREAFLEHCRETLREKKAADRRHVGEMLLPRLTQAEQKWLGQRFDGDSDDIRPDRLENIRSLFAAVRDEAARHSVDGAGQRQTLAFVWNPPTDPLIMEHVNEWRKRYYSMLDEIDERYSRLAGDIEEYVAKPLDSHIGILSRGILWE